MRKGISKNYVRLIPIAIGTKPTYWFSRYIKRLRQAQSDIRQAQSDSTSRVFRDTFKQKSFNYLLLFTSLIFYCLLAFWIERHQTNLLLPAFGFLFASYLWSSRAENPKEILFWVYASIFFRCCFLFFIPHLSDDFYRFIWDGRLLAAGYHPFAELPRYYIENKISIEGIDQTLFQKLNSPDYFTIYPPVNQFIFWLSAKLSSGSILGSVIVMRSFILAAEVGNLWLIKKILRHYQLPEKNILLYALNPLVIIELTGNLHFEALMIFFLLLSYWLLTKNKLFLSALQFSLAICSKLIPIILLPLLLVRLGWKKSAVYYLVVVVFSILFFLPLLNTEIISGFQESIGYYFKKFEFNASIYYLVREWGFWKYGYNIIQTVGIKLAMYCTGAILLYALRDFIQNSKLRIDTRALPTCLPDRQAAYRLLPTAYLFTFCIYLSFSTIVHPWYITSILAFSVFTRFSFPIIWTGLIFLTYIGYTANGFTENLWITAIEYVVVIGYLAYELIWKKEKLYA
jgi:alpha-1,6-mannosyltransferase